MIWVRRAKVVLIGGALLTVTLVYGLTELINWRRVLVDLPPIRAATGKADVAEGGRLAHIVGCLGCHGDAGQGRILLSDWRMGRVVAPSLARIATKASDQQLARAIRNGVSVDARRLYGMPTGSLGRLSDQDVARIIGWIRALPQRLDDVVTPKNLGPLARLGMLTGHVPSALNRDGGQPVTRPANVGPYLVAISCARCHALDEDRQDAGNTPVAPALAPAVAAYERRARGRGMRGEAVSDWRALAKARSGTHRGIDALTGREVAAIDGWLRSRTGDPAAR